MPKTETLIEPRGVVLDRPPEEVEVERWSQLRNCVFRDLATQRVRGYAPWVSLPAGVVPHHCVPCIIQQTPYWVVIGSDSGVIKAWSITTSATVEITPVGGINALSEPWMWTSGQINGAPYLNNTLDAPWYWDGQGALQELPGWPANTTCRALRDHKYHLIALGLIENSVQKFQKMMWSSAAGEGIPSSWTPAPDNEAGDNVLSGDPYGIVDGGTLRDNFVIYKPNSAWLMTYIGGVLVYAFRRLELEIGVLWTNCWTDLGGEHLCLSNDDIATHDTQRTRSISTHMVRRNVVNTIDPSNFEMCQVVHRNELNEAWICIPEVGNAQQTKAYVWNTVTESWGLRDLPMVNYIGTGIVLDDSGDDGTFDDPTDDKPFDEETETFNQVLDTVADDFLMLAQSGNMYVVDRADDNAGEDVVAEAIRESIPWGDTSTVHYCDEVWPRFVGEAGQKVRVRIGGQLWFSDPINWSPEFEYTFGQQPAKVYCHVVGRYISIQIKSTGGKPWRFYGMKLRTSERGRF